jgi:hypothetical protein
MPSAKRVSRTRAALLLAGGMVIAARANPASAADALPLISLNPGDGGIEIVASVVAVEAGTVTGDLTIDRRGSSGTVTTRQSRELALDRGETGQIARTGISFGADDFLEIRLALSKGGKVIAETVVSTK